MVRSLIEINVNKERLKLIDINDKVETPVLCDLSPTTDRRLINAQ